MKTLAARLLFILLTAPLLAAFAQVDEINELIGGSQYEKAIQQIDSLLPITKDYSQQARLHQLKADALYYLNDINQSLQSYLKSMQTFEEANDTKGLRYYEVVSHTGFCYRALGLYARALYYYKRGVLLAGPLGDSLEIATSFSNLGSTYAKMGHLDSGIVYFKNAYQIDLLRKDTAAIGFALRNLAEMQLENKDYEGALRSARSSLQLLKESTGNANSHALRLHLMGKAFAGLHQYDTAKHYFLQSDKELQYLGDSLYISINRLAMSELELSRSNFSEALRLAEMSRRFISNLPGESAHKMAIRNAMLTVYLAQGFDERALVLINENLAAADELGLINAKRDVLLQRATLFERRQEVGKALRDFKAFRILNDSILKQTAQRQLNELTIEYDVDHLNQKNEILELENKLAKIENARKDSRIRWIVTVSLSFILLTLALAWLYYSRQKLKNQLLSEEINNLRNQIKLAVEGDITALQLDLATINKKLQTPLSDRELEILRLTLSDLSNSQIAEKIFVSVNTVKFHLKNIYDKIGVANRKEALQFALKTQGN